MILIELLDFVFLWQLLGFLFVGMELGVFHALLGNYVHLLAELVVLGCTLLEDTPD
jgi:hypothetical protein